LRLDTSAVVKLLSTSLVFHFKLRFVQAPTSETTCNLLRLNADKEQEATKTTNSSAIQNAISGNRNNEIQYMSW